MRGPFHLTYPILVAAVLWIAFISVAFCLPELDPVNTKTLDYAPGCSSRDRPYLRPGADSRLSVHARCGAGGVRVRTIRLRTIRDGVSSVSSSSSAVAVTAAVPASVSARGQVESRKREAVVHMCAGRLLKSSSLSGRERQRTQLHSARSFGSQGSRQRQQQEEGIPPSLSVLSQFAQSEAQTRTRTPSPAGAWVPIAF